MSVSNRGLTLVPFVANNPLEGGDLALEAAFLAENSKVALPCRIGTIDPHTLTVVDQNPKFVCQPSLVMLRPRLIDVDSEYH